MSIYKMNTGQIMKFVELYKSSNCLWDHNLPEYKDRIARDRALKYISDQMEIVGFGPKEVAQKIKNIRTAYKQELKKIVNHKSNLCPDFVYRPKVPWFECADSFLNSLYSGFRHNRHEKLQMETERFNSPASSQEEQETTEAQKRIKSLHDSLSQGVPAKSRQVSFNDHPRSSCGSEAFENIDQLRKLPRKGDAVETEFDLWARSLAVQLNDMNVCRALKLQLQVQMLVTNERLEYESSAGTSLHYGYGQFNRVDWQPQDTKDGYGLSSTNPSFSTHRRTPSPTFVTESVEMKMSPVSLYDEDSL